MIDHNQPSKKQQPAVADHLPGVLNWQCKTIDELCCAIPIQEQMIVSMLAAAWQSEAGVWDAATLKALLESFARDVNTTTEHQIANALSSISSGTGVLAALTSNGVIGTLTHEALKIAVAKRQLNEFFNCWQERPLISGVLVPHEQTILSKVLRFSVTGLVVMNVVVFIMLFIIPEFQKIFGEFGLEMTPAAQFLMIWAARFTYFWFIPFFLMLAIGFYYLRGPSIGKWLQRWSSRNWTALHWHGKDQKRLFKAWELRPAVETSAVLTGETGGVNDTANEMPRTISRWGESPSMIGILSKSESAALSMTDDKELKDWLFEKMIGAKRLRRASTRKVWATILLGAGHCLIGLIVFLVALSIFGSLLAVIYGLAGGQP